MTSVNAKHLCNKLWDYIANPTRRVSLSLHLLIYLIFAIHSGLHPLITASKHGSQQPLSTR